MLAACGKDVTATVDAPAASPDGSGSGSAMEVGGMISSNQTWSGAIDLVGPATIATGVTVTVMPGTTISARTGSSLSVDGRLDIEGTKAAPVALTPSGAGWYGLNVAGSLEMHYAEETGGGIVVNGGTITVMDTLLAHHNNSQDYLIMNGGMIDVEYSSIVPMAQTTDLIHCDMHANSGAALTIKVVHTNLSGASFAIDWFNGSGNFTYNNWFSNQTDVYTEPGSPVMGDVSFGWFEAGAPTAAQGSSITADSLSPTRLTDAGPR